MSRLFFLLLLILLPGGFVFGQGFEKAERYHRLLLKKPGNATVFDRFVEAWLDAGSKDELQTWLEENSKEGEAADWRILAAFHDYLGEGEEAVAALDEAIKKDEENLDLRFARAEMRGKIMDFELALEDLELVVEDESFGVKAMKLKGKYLARLGRPEEAVEEWKKLVQQFPNDRELREDLIETEIIEGLYDEAIAESRNLIKLTVDPYQKALYRLRLAEIQLLSDRMEDGLETYRTIFSSTGEGAWLEREVLSQVERVFTLEDDVKGLREFYQELREKYPRRVSVRKGLAKHMARYGEMEEAIGLFREILKSTPGDVGNREEFIAMLEANAMWQEARLELKELIKLKSEDPLLWEKLVSLEFQLNNREALKGSLKKLRELKSKTPDGVIAVAEIYGRVKFPGKAEEILRKGRETFSKSTEIVEALASLLVEQKKMEEAKDLWLSMAASGARDDVLRVTRSLAGHQLQKEAFELLLGYAEENQDDPLVLTQLGKLAVGEEQAIKTTPFMLELVRLASSPTDLENAISLASSVVGRSKQPGAAIADLAEKPELLVAEQCFLADLHLREGDIIKARKALKEAGDGLLATFYQIRFEEKQGDLSTAIEQLEEVVKMPDGRKTVHLRRLVALYQRSGRIREALEQAEEWKKTAPGDQQAWITRAKLLQEAGLLDEAVLEQRRIIGRFGPDSEHRARLAEVLEKSGDLQSAEKIYEKLYEEGEGQTAKLKWIEPWARLAMDAGREEQLIERFSRIRDRNRKEVGAVLALAEVYRVIGRIAERKEALLEVARRRPEDSRFLIRIAEVAGREGDFEFAISTLRGAVALDQGVDAKRALVKVLLQYRELDEGLEILQSIPGEGDDPRKVEKTVASFAQVGEWDAAATYLEGGLGKNPDDWRLAYLKGIILKNAGKPEEALRVFRSLNREVAPLAGLKSLTEIPEGMPAFDPRTGRSPKLEWMQRFSGQLFSGQGDFSFPSSRSRSIRSSSRNSLFGMPLTFNLPDSPEILRLMAFVQVANLLSSSKEVGANEAFEEILKMSSGDQELLLLTRFRPEQYREFLLKELAAQPDDVRLSTLWLTRNGMKPEDEEIDKAAIEVLRNKAPLEGIRQVFARIGRDLFEREEVEEIITGDFKKLSDEDRIEAINLVLPLVTAQTGFALENPLSSEFEKFVESKVLELAKAPINGNSMNALFQKALREERGGDAIAFVNRCLKWWFELPNAPKSVYPVYRRSQNTYGPPVYPIWSGQAWLYMKSNIPALRQSALESDETRKKHHSLVSQLQESSLEPAPLQPAEVLKPHAHKITHPVYRGVVFKMIGAREELAEHAGQLRDSKEHDELRFAAAYYTAEKNYLEAYRTLVKMRVLELERGERNLLDGNLAYIGNLLGPDEAALVDLGPARDAVLRVQRRTSRGSLGGVMRKLGLHEEADRIDRIKRAKSSRKKIPKRKITRPLTGTNLIKHELANGDAGKAVNELVKTLKLSRNDPGQDRKILQTIRLFTKSEHVDLLLKTLKPGEKSRADRWYVHAVVARELGRREVALEGFETFLKENPENQAAVVGRHVCQKPEDRNWDLFSPKKNPKTAENCLLFLTSYYHNSTPRSFTLMIEIAEMGRRFLQEIREDKLENSGVLQIGDFVTTSAREYAFGDSRIQPLTGLTITPGDEFDSERSEKRIKVYKKLLDEMLAHTSLAEKSFGLLKTNAKLMKLTDEDLFQFANRALVHLPPETHALDTIDRVSVLNRSFSSTRIQTSSWAYHDSSSILTERKRLAIQHLLSVGKEKGHEIFTPAALAYLKDNQPVRLACYEKAREICEASPDQGKALHQECLGHLPKEGRERTHAVREMSRFLMSFGTSDMKWLEAHQELVVKSMGDGVQLSSWMTEWGHWILQERGRKMFYDLIARASEETMGDRDKWAVVSRLPSHHWPPSYQTRVQKLSRIMQVFSSDARLTEPVASAIRMLGLQRLQPSPLSSLRSNWGKQIKKDPEVFITWMKEAGGMQKVPGEEFADPARLLVFLAATRFLKNSKQSTLQILERELTEDKEFSPLMAALLKARLGVGPDIPTLLEKHVDSFEAMVGLSPSEVSILFAEWFPGFDISKTKPQGRILIERVSRTMRESAYEDVIEESALNGGAYAYFKSKRSWPTLVRVAGYSPVEAARAFETLLLEYLEFAPGTDSSRLKVFESYVDTALQYLGRGASCVSIARRVKFVHRLFNGKLKDRLVMPEHQNFMLGNSIRANLDSDLEDLLEKEPFSGSIDGVVKVLFPILDQLKPAERQTFILLIPPAFFNGWEGGRGMKNVVEFDWLDDEVRKSYPEVVDYLQALMAISFQSEDENHEEVLKNLVSRGKGSLLRFMNSCELSSAFKMKLAYLFIYHENYRRLVGSREHWDWLGEVVDVYENSGNRPPKEIISNLTAQLALHEIETWDFVPRKFLDSLTGALVRIDKGQSKPWSYQVNGASRLLPLVLRLNDLENARRLVLAHPSTFGRDLGVLWDLFVAGEEDLVGKVINLKSETYGESGTHLFGKATPEQLERFLSLLPEEKQYYVEFLISLRPDAADENAPEKSRELRLLDLARRFSEEGPAKGYPRLHPLGTFALMDTAREVLRKELDVIEKKHRLGAETNQYVRDIIKVVVSEEIAEGRFASARRQYQSICGMFELRSSLVDDATEILAAVVHEVLPECLGDVEKAKQSCALADFFFRETVRLNVKDGRKILNQAEAFSFFVRLLARDESGWQTMFEGLGKGARERHAGMISTTSLADRMQKIKGPSWRDEDKREMRLTLQKLLWTSKRYQVEVKNRPGYSAAYFTSFGLALSEEIGGLLDELPTDLDQAHFFLWRRAVAGGANEESLKMFQEARKIAREREEGELESEILVSHIERLLELDRANPDVAPRKEEILKLAREVQIDLLKQPGPKKIVTDLLEEIEE